MTMPEVSWSFRREGVAAAAVILRWGSYLAVLLDRDKPVWAIGVTQRHKTETDCRTGSSTPQFEAASPRRRA